MRSRSSWPRPACQVPSAQGSSRRRPLDEVGRCEEAAREYRQYALLVGRVDPIGAARAQAYAVRCTPAQEVVVDPAMETVGVELVTRHYRAALDASELVGRAARESGWYDYHRAAAFTGLGRTDDAVASYRAAERAFGTRDPRGLRLAVYGRARALDAAGRCREANIAYGQYAVLVAASSPEDAAMAMTVARACVVP